MMQALLWLALAVLGFALSAAPVNKSKAAPRKKASTAKSSGVKPGAKTASAQRAPSRATSKSGPSRKGSTVRASSKSSAKRRGTSSSARRRRPTIPSFRAGQQQPTPDRVKDIQSALISRGYMQGEADGNWGGSTVDALKRFQQDQNLNADGKLTSMSLIALGLGPKRSGLAAVPKPAAVPAQASPDQVTPPVPPPPAPAELPPPPLPVEQKEPQ
ncbi:MAG: peptidoglycan-binding protein [Bryobacterales bacterium]|nr:peptidoglycan-binding protein [Bryobacterales bacterium]